MNKKSVGKQRYLTSTRFTIATLITVSILLGVNPSVRAGESLQGKQHETKYYLVKQRKLATLKTLKETANKQSEYTGRFKVVYSQLKKPEYRIYQTLFTQSKTFETIANTLNENLLLPIDIPIILTECGQVNAFYTPKQKAIVVCYELSEDFAKFSSRYATSEEDLLKSTLGGTVFAFFHELAHALIHVLDLPVVGREEDAADQLAVVMITAGGSSFGESSALVVASQYRANAQKVDPSSRNLPYWDEHSLDMQRYYNIICLLYGSNPSKYASIAKVGELPGARARSCPREYQQAKNSWFRLLEPHTRSRQSPSRNTNLW